MGQGIAAANVKRGYSGRADGCRPGCSRPRRSRRAERSRVQQAAQRPGCEAGGRARAACQRHVFRYRTCRTPTSLSKRSSKSPRPSSSCSRGLNRLLKDDTILCSNTSTIPITQLAAGLEQPERFCGLHFFNPVRQMPLVEVIRGKQDERRDDRHRRRLRASARQIADRDERRARLPGQSAAAAVHERSRAAAVRRREHQGHRAGGERLRHADGADSRCTTWSESTWPFTPAARWLTAFPDRVVPAPIVDKLFERGRIGQKAGNGFFDYGPSKGGKPPRGTDSPEVAQLIDECRTGEKRKFSQGRNDRSAVPADARRGHARAGRQNRDRRARCRSRADLGHRVSTVPRRAVLLGRPSRSRPKSSKSSSNTRRSASVLNRRRC